MPIAQPRSNGQRTHPVSPAGGVRRCEKLIGDLGHRADNDDGCESLSEPAANDFRCAQDGGCVLDGGAAELHHDQIAHAWTATGWSLLASGFPASSFPNDISSSAFSSAAPAAPRIVLCESTVNFQSSSPQGRSLPTVAAMPPPRILSNLGWGRSSRAVNSTGCAGAVGKLRPASGINSRHASRISSRDALRDSFTLTLSVCPSSTATRLQCAVIFAARGFTILPSRTPSRRSVSASIFSSSFLT